MDLQQNVLPINDPGSPGQASKTYSANYNTQDIVLIHQSGPIQLSIVSMYCLSCFEACE